MPRSASGAGSKTPKKNPNQSQDQGRTPYRNVVEGQRFKANVSDIAPNPRNVREEWEWEGDEFEEFVANVGELGQLQDPSVIARSVFTEAFPQDAKNLPDETQWVLGMGERRWRTAQQLGQKQIPVVLCNANVHAMDEVLWSENQSRSGLNPIQEGVIFTRFREEKGWSLQQIAERLGKRVQRELNISGISKRIKLASGLEGDVRQAVSRGKLGIEPAYRLLTQLETPDLITKGYALMQDTQVTADVAISSLLTPVEDLPDTTDDQPDGQTSSGAAADSSAADGNETFSSTKTDPGSATAIPAQNTGPEGQDGQDGQGKDEDEDEDKSDGPFSSTKTGGKENQPHTPEELSARQDALRRVLRRRNYGKPTELTLRLASALVSRITDQEETRALALLDEKPTQPWRGKTLVRVADAAGLALDEQRYLNHAASKALDTWDEKHMQLLVEQAGYEPTPAEQERSALLTK